MSVLLWGTSLYVFVMLITTGHFLRLDKHLTPKHCAYILIAPFWWILTKGVRGTLEMMGQTVYENHLLWAVGFVAAGHFLASAERCSSIIGCVDLGIKAAFLSLPPVAFIYWGYVI